MNLLADDSTIDLQIKYNYSKKYCEITNILTSLLTLTPIARFVTLNTTPVLPW